MAQQIEQPAPLRLSRIFRASREKVFMAWSSAEHVKNWFCPNAFTIPEAKVDMREGGPFEVRMSGPGGMDFWTRGSFAEVSRFDRLVLDLHAEDAGGNRLFRAYTEVDFADVEGGTRMDVVQSYTFADPSQAAAMVAGAPQGWSETLDKLEAEVTRMQNAKGVAHGMFRLERVYDSPVERVYEALSTEAAKSQWFAGIEGQWELLERKMDFRAGGQERLKGRWMSGTISTFDAIYHDIVPCERVVYSYEMHLDDRKISVSLATVELKALGPRSTSFVITEQGAFFNGYDDGGSREHGTVFLLDRLGASLD
jgi:uncharacterized protein YndB with AHSA1/START domain